MKGSRRAAAMALGAVVVVAAALGAVWPGPEGGAASDSRDPTSSVLRPLVRGVTRAGAPFETWTAGTIMVGKRKLSVVIADDGTELVAGLRGRRDAAPYDGMLFVFPSDTRAAFTMAGVLAPLDIGFYAVDGTTVGRLRMEPCAGTDATCPVYRAPGAFRFALETAPGVLPAGRLRARRTA